MIIDLDFFGDILRRELADSCTSEPVVADFEAKKKQIQTEAARIEKALFQLLLSDIPECDVMRRVHGLQSYTIWMADQALRHVEERGGWNEGGKRDGDRVRGLARLLCKTMCDLLSYMEKCFGIHFNADAEVPECYAIARAAELEALVAEFRDGYRRRRGDETLLAVLQSVLNKAVVRSAGTRMTFARIRYLTTVVTTLVQDVRETDDDVTRVVLDRLLYLNFNAAAFVGYYTRSIRADVGGFDTPARRADRLAYYRKVVSQLQPKPGYGFHLRKAPCVKSQLVHWISEELAYEERTRSDDDALAAVPSARGVKVATDVSVAHLAAFCRVLIRSGSVRTTNVSEFIGFVAEHVTTTHQEEVSKASLRNKYYEVGDESATLVAGWLERLSATIRGWR